MGNTVAVDTLGCKLNQAESECLALELAAAGYRLVTASAGADAYILNTCTVTHVADRKSRHLLRLARRRNPQALVIAVGCYARRAPQELAKVEAVDAMLGNWNAAGILSLLQERGITASEPAVDASDVLRTRSMVKIEQGCNGSCAYCIVPLVRGGERSEPVEDVISLVKERVSQGYREITLTGTQIGAYRPGLEPLVRCVLDGTGVERLRLSSLRLSDITGGLLALWRDSRLCPHLHLSLQSGSDTVLHRMRRPYSTADYARVVRMVRGAVPGVAITTDVMVGFPGETGEEFEESLRFCREMGFARMHVFSYSDRPGTAGAVMEPKVPQAVKQERSGEMLSLAAELFAQFCEQYLGRTVSVLWETEVERGVWSGLTGNYIRVFAQSSEPLRNKLTPVRLTGWRGRDLWGVPSIC